MASVTVDEVPVAAFLSPEYAELLRSTPDVAAGERTVTAGWPDWRNIFANQMRQGNIDQRCVPDEWLENIMDTTSRLPLGAALCALCGVGAAVHARLLSDGGVSFVSEHGPRFKTLPHGSALLSSIIEQGLSSDPCDILMATSVLCVQVEVALRALWFGLHINGESIPALLRDLLLDCRISDRLPPGLGPCLKVILLPSGLNLRNLVLHGFLAPEELPREYFALLLSLVGSVSGCLEAEALPNQLGTSVAREGAPSAACGWTAMPESLDQGVLRWLALDSVADDWLGSSSAFVPPGRVGMICWGIKQIRNGRTALGALALMLVLEHGLRRLFCNLNCAPEYGIARHGAYYSTLDGFGQRSKHQLLLGPVVESDGRANLLLPHLGCGLLYLLSDLFLQDAGPNIRAMLVHGRSLDFRNLYEKSSRSLPLACGILCFLVLCARHLPRKGDDPPGAVAALDFADTVVIEYAAVYHPDAQLARVVSSTLDALEELTVELVGRLPISLEQMGRETDVRKQEAVGKELLLKAGSTDICFTCDAAITQSGKGSLLLLVSDVRRLLREVIRPQLVATTASTSPFDAISVLRAFPSEVFVDSIAANPSPAKNAVASDFGWLRDLAHPQLADLSQSVPFFPLIRCLAEAIFVIARALTARIKNLEACIVAQRARTRQRKHYSATLLTGPAFAEYMAAVMVVLERHIRQSRAGGKGISEDALGRLSRVTEALTLLGVEDNSRKGYDVGLSELASFLKTRAARVVFTSDLQAG
eukprot:TRINITY_DN48348_c0_g1_i1.p1 TRINITY_DN48348_c0_g1~~TRINITY_DN48348_c0_g1_i1.p1  ORF type:complete len:761 (+),score=68.27 TRINITY_DN48348_c0_g1_i1:376-2658(+)